MAHTKSRQRILSELRAMPLTSWLGWTVQATCQRGTAATVAIEALLAQPEPPERLSDMLVRLRCRCCGGSATSVSLRRWDGRDEWTQPLTGWAADDLTMRKVWQKEPDRFTESPNHQNPGLNT